MGRDGPCGLLPAQRPVLNLRPGHTAQRPTKHRVEEEMSVSTEAAPAAISRPAHHAEPIPARSIPEVVWASAERRGDAPAMWRRINGTYQPTSYRELTEKVQAIAQGLAQLGFAPGERLALLSENRMEWALTDLAALCLGGTTVGMFASLPAGQI